MTRNELLKIFNSSNVLDLDEIARNIMAKDHIKDTRFVTLAEHCLHICGANILNHSPKETGRDYFGRTIIYILNHANSTIMETE